MLGADEFDARAQIGWKTFVIYQGHHGDHGAARADVILPGAAYTEKDGIYVNTEGRPQAARKASSPPGEAHEDWKILRALSDTLGKPLAYDTLAQLRARITEDFPHLTDFGQIKAADWGSFGEKGKLSKDPLRTPVQNFYLTNVICRASDTMKACAQNFKNHVKDEMIAEAAE